MSERVQVLEYCTPHIKNGVIRGVKIIGLKSRNGRRYPRKVLREAAALYETAAVFTLHPDARERKLGMRRLVDHFGSLQNVHERHGGKTEFGLYGNLHVKMSHPMAEAVIEQVEAGDAKFGLSHNAMCELSEDRKQVLKIDWVSSVDLVDNPGTNTNLFEEEEMAETPTVIADDDGEKDDAKLETILEGMAADLKSQAADLKEMRAELDQLKPGEDARDKKKKDRLSVLEDRSGEEGGDGPPPIGNSHEDFLTVMRGYPVV